MIPIASTNSTQSATSRLETAMSVSILPAQPARPVRGQQFYDLLKPFLAIAFITIALAGCDLYGQDDYEEQYVVESYLIANRAMPEIRLSTTAPFNENYYFEERAVSGAVILVNRYDDAGNKDKTYSYREQDNGIYIPQNEDTADLVMPRHLYRLEIEIPDDNGHRIEAVTHVPDTFSVKEVIRDRAVYQSPDQLEFNITRNRANGRQIYFIYSTESLEPSEETITPFWKDVVDNYIEARRIRTTIINEENFDINADGTLTLRMPWIGIAFYGPNIISTFSIDDNAYDFFRSQPVQAGGGAGSLSPGEIQNIIYHMEGGIGLFGSMSVLDIEVMVDEPAGTNSP